MMVAMEALGKVVRRREFIALLGGATTWPLAARGQQPDRMRLIGVLMGYAESDSAAQSVVAAFRGGLAKLGWTEGSNLRIELRWGAGDADRIRTYAKELVDLRRSRAGSKLAKSQRRKQSAPKCRNTPNAVRNRGVSFAGKERVVARLTYERDDALLRETANFEILRLRPRIWREASTRK